MSIFVLCKYIVLTGFFFLMVGCVPVDQGTVTLFDTGTEQAVQQMEATADSNPANIPGFPGDEMETMEVFDPSAWNVYTDDTYGFKVAHPEYFEIKTAQENDLIPLPLETIHFVDMRSELAGIAPPSFSIRIYENANQQTLGAWLKFNGLHNNTDWLHEFYSGVYFSGLRVLSKNYMSPGDFVYVAKDTWIFQLTPVGGEAGAMLDTFEFTQ